jgi:uncharacterized membrane protein YkoI
MLRSLKFAAIALATLIVAEPAVAQFKPNNRVTLPYLRKIVPPVVRPPLPLLMLTIQPSEAAAIAQAQWPGSKVVKVKLRGDIYAVTLRTDNSLVRVLVSGQDGSIL